MNTKDYGIPQNRSRVYIVGNKEGSFNWPERTEMGDIQSCVDHTNITQTPWGRKYSLNRVNPMGVFIDADFIHYTSYPSSHMYSPCVLARPSSLWCKQYHRYATCKEFLSLQGFDRFKQVVCNSRAKKQIGNSMSVNVVKAIIEELVK